MFRSYINDVIFIKSCKSLLHNYFPFTNHEPDSLKIVSYYTLATSFQMLLDILLLQILTALECSTITFIDNQK